ncbi:MAG: TetR/AcrR family transcriptional regulator [Clostridia bacterium]|nr:TetR/AcrR family transcriptional regulator [Clostridia bacterium]
MKRKKDNELIYETALKLFAQYGYKKTTLEDIANKLNMSNSNIYSYADSKKSLYQDCVGYAISKWQLKIFDTVKEVYDPAEKLRISFRIGSEYLSQDTILCDILKNDPSIFPMFSTYSPLEKFNNCAIKYIRDILDDGIKKGVFQNINAQDTAVVLFNIYKIFIIETYIRQENPNIGKYFQTMVDLLENGVLKR